MTHDQIRIALATGTPTRALLPQIISLYAGDEIVFRLATEFGNLQDHQAISGSFAELLKGRGV